MLVLGCGVTIALHEPGGKSGRVTLCRSGVGTLANSPVAFRRERDRPVFPAATFLGVVYRDPRPPLVVREGLHWSRLCHSGDRHRSTACPMGQAVRCWSPGVTVAQGRAGDTADRAVLISGELISGKKNTWDMLKHSKCFFVQ